MWIAFLLTACSTPTEAPAPSAAPAATEAPAPGTNDAGTPTARAPKNRPPEIASVTITPAEIRATDPLRATVKATDPEGAVLDLDYEWFVNDVAVIDVATEQLGAGRFKKGDAIRVHVTADDGENEVALDSATVKVLNTAPVFVTHARAMSRVDGFAFEVADADGDALTWRLDGAPKGMSISPEGVLTYQGTEDEAGGRYTVAVIVEDGEAWGRFEFPLTVTAGSKAKTAAK